MTSHDAALSPFGVKTTGPTIHDLPDEAVAFLQAHGRLRVYRQGEMVQCNQRALSVASWIQQGRLLTVVDQPDGAVQHRGWVMPSELFGIFNLLLPDCPARNNLLVVTEEAHVLHFSREVLLEMMHRHPQARWGIAVCLSKRIRQLHDIIDVSGPGTLEGKLRRVLMWWSGQFCTPARDGSVELWVTQNDLANGVGASRQRVQMELKAMRQRGEIELAHRKIILRPVFFESRQAATG